MTVEEGSRRVERMEAKTRTGKERRLGRPQDQCQARPLARARPQDRQQARHRARHRDRRQVKHRHSEPPTPLPSPTRHRVGTPEVAQAREGEGVEVVIMHGEKQEEHLEGGKLDEITGDMLRPTPISVRGQTIGLRAHH